MRCARIMLVSVLAVAGCSFVARDTATYERDTAALLDTRDEQVRRCFEAELAHNPDLIGKLTVTFTVEKQTGKLTVLSWDRNRSSVNDSLATCVLTAFEGLALAEPDRRDGEATFTYSFRSVDD